MIKGNKENGGNFDKKPLAKTVILSEEPNSKENIGEISKSTQIGNSANKTNNKDEQKDKDFATQYHKFYHLIKELKMKLAKIPNEIFETEGEYYGEGNFATLKEIEYLDNDPIMPNSVYYFNGKELNLNFIGEEGGKKTRKQLIPIEKVKIADKNEKKTSNDKFIDTP